MDRPAAPQTAHCRRAPVTSLARWATAGGLILAGLVLLLGIDTSRTWEAVASAWVLDTIYQVPASAMPGEPSIFVQTDLPWILTITMECAAGLILVPFLCIAAALASSGRFSTSRMLAGVVLACVVVLAVNQVRVATIGWALATRGSSGYAWWHTIGGSVMSLVGIAVALLILWRVGLREPRRPGPEPAGAAS